MVEAVEQGNAGFVNMNNLLYLSYGEGPHEDEVIFSVLSVLRWSPDEPRDFRILVFTDHPERFKGLPVVVEEISREQWEIWSGPFKFNHRRKILALEMALRKYDGPTILLDGDTWLRGPVESLFKRVEPGKSLMHLREGRISEIRSPLMEKFTAFIASCRQSDALYARFPVEPEDEIWNAGVVGLHPADSGVLEEVLSLTDALRGRGEFHILEQYAFSHVLRRMTLLQEGGDVVFHYWPPYLHQPFRRKLALVSAKYEHLPLESRALKLFAHRPRPTSARRVKVIVKRILQSVGLLKGRARSNEW